MRPIDASIISIRRSGRAGSVAARSGREHRPDHHGEGDGDPEPDPGRDDLLAEAGEQRHDAGDAGEDEDEADEPGLGQVEERAEALVHQASPRTAGRAPAPISSKEKTGLRMPLASSTVCRKRRRLVEVTTAG